MMKKREKNMYKVPGSPKLHEIQSNAPYGTAHFFNRVLSIQLKKTTTPKSVRKSINIRNTYNHSLEIGHWRTNRNHPYYIIF